MRESPASQYTVFLSRSGAAPLLRSSGGGRYSLRGTAETSTPNSSPSPGLSPSAPEFPRLLGLSYPISWGEVRAGPGRVLTPRSRRLCQGELGFGAPRCGWGAKSGLGLTGALFPRCRHKPGLVGAWGAEPIRPPKVSSRLASAIRSETPEVSGSLPCTALRPLPSRL